nr:hypothetical protein [Rickettsia endosymbiont of Ceutorhynchus assimilis]
MARIFDVILAKSGNPENNSHPEFISGSTKRCAKLVQHDINKTGFPFSGHATRPLVSEARYGIK